MTVDVRIPQEYYSERRRFLESETGILHGRIAGYTRIEVAGFAAIADNAHHGEFFDPWFESAKQLAGSDPCGTCKGVTTCDIAFHRRLMV